MFEVRPAVWARHPLVFVVEAADDAAYLTADIEDGVELGLIDVAHAMRLFRPLFLEQDEQLGPDYSALSRYRSRAIGGLMDLALREFKYRYEGLMLASDVRPLLDPDASNEVAALKEAARQSLFTAHAKVKREVAGREAWKGCCRDLRG